MLAEVLTAAVFLLLAAMLGQLFDLQRRPQQVYPFAAEFAVVQPATAGGLVLGLSWVEAEVAHSHLGWHDLRPELPPLPLALEFLVEWHRCCERCA